MDLRHLKYFLAVAQELNIGRAAARLHISQPPLTRQIKALEDELGVELFVRTAKGVELTQAGEMFKEEAHNIRMLVEAGIDRVQRAGEGKLGRIDVGIFGSGIYDIIPKLLQDFRRKLPGVNVVLHTMNKNEQIEALRQRRITVAFNRMTEPQPDIGRELVATECLYAALPEDHPLAALKAVPLRAMADDAFVVFPNVGRPNFVDRVVELCRQQGFEAQISQEVGDAVTGLALVARGFGVTLIPESAARSLTVHGTVVRPLSDRPQAVIDLSCLYRATDQSPLLKAFLAVVRENREAQAQAQAHTPHDHAAEAAPPPII
ncbi:MAG: LysR family transcriptional regulator [Proteobacteria bacterium]|uniref:LysR family transcriptional regulator n=1 Tax=Aquabacterium sp. TaxID=1872578 RepID=UPI0035C6867F|nr:LysR family transcriptional regulator [Pseudomonadota bacterium]